MSFQRQLALSIAAVLAVILIILGLSSISFWDIEGFVTSMLPRHITIARTYERFADKWFTISEIAEGHASNPATPLLNLSIENTEVLNGYLEKLSNLVIEKDRKERLQNISRLCGSFTSQLENFELLLKRRNNIIQKKSINRTKAAEGLWEEVTLLLNRFKEMMKDFKETLRNPGFRSSLSQTSTLMIKIEKVEKDLLLAETEVALYISLNQGKKAITPTTKKSKGAASRVEKRLRAIEYLLENSLKDSENPLHKRVLMQIQRKVGLFSSSFFRLRNLLEAPQSELFEAEDNIQKMIEELSALRKKGVNESSREAEIYWGKIYEISDQLKSHAKGNYRIVSIFLLIVLVFGIYVYLVIPKRLGGPLRELNKEIESFRLGNEIKDLPKSNTQEIDSLANAFQIMAERLNFQGEVNRNYLESIHSLNEIYRELHETQKRLDNPNERLEKAINLILQQLISQCPNIDIVKVMVLQKAPGDDKTFLSRLGDPEFSERFLKSEEAQTYFESTSWNPVDKSQSLEETLPADLGISGWYFENSVGIKTGSEDASFFQPIYSPPPISDNAILANRKYERGLNGCVVTEPLIVNGQESDQTEMDKGLLFVYYLDRETRLSWQEIFFIQIIASQIASIIETDGLLQQHDLKKKMDTQLNMAREIQENLLPQNIPSIKGLRLSKVSKSAGEVGGDYYDFFELGNKKLGIVIADASGKNVPAAIIMTVFKTTLSTMDLDTLSASEVLSRANKIIARNITNDRFITAMYVIVDAETGSIELSSAGHNPAFVISGRGHELVIHEKNIRGVPLGIIEDYSYDSETFKMTAGDMLFLYTDGVTEARNANEEEFGESRLKRFLGRPRGLQPAKDLLNEINEFSLHADQHDDITAVSVEFVGEKKNG